MTVKDKANELSNMVGDDERKMLNTHLCTFAGMNVIHEIEDVINTPESLAYLYNYIEDTEPEYLDVDTDHMTYHKMLVEEGKRISYLELYWYSKHMAKMLRQIKNKLEELQN